MVLATIRSAHRHSKSRGGGRGEEGEAAGSTSANASWWAARLLEDRPQNTCPPIFAWHSNCA